MTNKRKGMFLVNFWTKTKELENIRSFLDKKSWKNKDKIEIGTILQKIKERGDFNGF